MSFTRFKLAPLWRRGDELFQGDLRRDIMTKKGDSSAWPAANNGIPCSEAQH